MGRTTTARNSAIELLRIISIFMVISLHYSFWGGGRGERHILY